MLEEELSRGAEAVFSGMTRTEFFGCFACVVLIFALSLWILNFVFNLKMVKFAEICEELKEIRRKIKSGDELYLIACRAVTEHEGRCHRRSPRRTPK